MFDKGRVGGDLGLDSWPVEVVEPAAVVADVDVEAFAVADVEFALVLLNNLLLGLIRTFVSLRFDEPSPLEQEFFFSSVFMPSDMLLVDRVYLLRC